MFFCASACDSTARLLTESRASSCGAEDSEEGHMDPAVFLVALVTVVGTAAVTIVKVARLWTGRPESPSADVTARLEALERGVRSEEHTSELQSRLHLVCRLLLEKKKKKVFESRAIFERVVRQSQMLLADS